MHSLPYVVMADRIDLEPIIVMAHAVTTVVMADHFDLETRRQKVENVLDVD